MWVYAYGIPFRRRICVSLKVWRKTFIVMRAVFNILTSVMTNVACL